MNSSTTDQVLRAIADGDPMDKVLTAICTLCCAPDGGAEGGDAAALFAAGDSGQRMEVMAAVGLSPGDITVAEPFMPARLKGADHQRHCLPLDGVSCPGFERVWGVHLADAGGNHIGALAWFTRNCDAPGDARCRNIERAADLATIALNQADGGSEHSLWAGMLENVVNNVNQGICVFDKDFRLLHFNAVYEDLYDFPEGFLKKGRHYSEILRFLIERGEYGDVDPDTFLRERMANLPEGEEWRNLRHRPDGTVIAIYRKNLPGGGAIITFTDVTADLRLTMENQRTAKLLEITTNNIIHGIRVIDGNGRITLWNRRYQELFGFPDGLMKKGMHYTVLLRYVADRDGMNEHEAQKFISSRLRLIKQPDIKDTTRTLDDGTVVRIERAPMPGGGFVATYTDISRLVSTERELAKKSDLLTTTLDNINQGLLVLDSDLNVALFNHAYLRLMDLGPNEVTLGMPYRRVLEIFAAKGEFDAGHGTEEEGIQRRLDLAGSNQVRHSIHRRPNGTIINVYRKPMPGGGRVMTYTDITDLKNAEAKLVAARDLAEEANRAKTEFLANMSHELRTPLNAIIGFSEIMANGMYGDVAESRYKDYIQGINDSGKHLLSLINDILDLSKVEVGKAALDEELVDLTGVLQTCIVLVDEQAQRAGVSLISNFAPYVPPLLGDERRLKQIFINLLQNAIKFTPRGGTVTVEMDHRAGGPVHVTITDTGIGMSEEDIPRALERFSQVETGLKRKYEGAGLGLPLARTMTEMHQGTINIESKKGEGTSVRVTLPASRLDAPGDDRKAAS
ncbi:MAG: PAS-domain containing protein [Alphaproteobacteria bacterium]|nr:PAS-domain containing protein [Alphaproteobacteria bacterium]